MFRFLSAIVAAIISFGLVAGPVAAMSPEPPLPDWTINLTLAKTMSVKAGGAKFVYKASVKNNTNKEIGFGARLALKREAFSNYVSALTVTTNKAGIHKMYPVWGGCFVDECVYYLAGTLRSNETGTLNVFTSTNNLVHNWTDFANLTISNPYMPQKKAVVGGLNVIAGSNIPARLDVDFPQSIVAFNYAEFVLNISTPAPASAYNVRIVAPVSLSVNPYQTATTPSGTELHHQMEVYLSYVPVELDGQEVEFIVVAEAKDGSRVLTDRQKVIVYAR